MGFKKIRSVLMLALGIVLVIGAILLFIFGVGNSEGFRRVMFVIIGLFLVIDGILILLLATQLGHEPENFFLYNRATDRNIDVRDLKFDQVNSRMSLYMTQISKSGLQMWTENILGSDSELFGECGLFKPLIAYKMLYDLTAVGNADIWLLFVNANPDVIRSIEQALNSSGDSEMGNTLIYLYENSEGKIDKIKEYITDSTKYIQGRMLKYVKINIDKFI